ncbi:MAG: hypothetical protein C4534_06365 [Gaiellales bacterium]|nr:MAG: hypothetical protein C4534_06365 [Gaiellales bacterium]
MTAALALSFFTMAPPAAPQQGNAAGGISVGLDRLVFGPGDTINFSIGLDAAGQTLSGELFLRVYPAASPAAADPFAPGPIAEKRLAEGVNVAGTAATTGAATLSELGLGAGGYPARVVLVSGGREVLAGDVWLAVVDPAAAPIDLVLLWTVGGPPQRDAQGYFTSSSLIDRCRNQPRSPDSILQHEALAREFPSIRTTYAVEPLLLDELLDITDGFTLTGTEGGRQFDAASPEAVQADACIESLRQLPTFDNVELVGTPYAFADLTLLARQGWSDGTGQYRLGHDVLAETLLLAEVPDGAYIPGLNLTTDSLSYVAATGGEYAVLAGYIRGSVQARNPGAMSHRLRDLSGERLTGFFADDGASSALLGSNPDPDAFFAGLANAHAAGTPLVIAAAANPAPAIAADLRRQVYVELSRQGWVHSITLAEANAKYRPDSEPATLLRYVDTATGYITRTYYDRLDEVHGLYEDFRAAVDAEEPQMVGITKMMFTAENSYWLSARLEPEAANSGLAVLNEIERVVVEELSGLEVKVKTPLVQTAAASTATVTITNNNAYDFTVELLLAADEDVSFPDGDRRELRIASGVTTVEVPYSGGGWSKIEARLLSRGNTLVADDAGIRHLTARFWLVSLLLAGLAGAAAGYYFLVVKRG